MRKEKGGKRGRKRMEDKDKEGEVEERVEVPELPEEGVERREEEEIEESCVCHFYRQSGSFHCGICKAAP